MNRPNREPDRSLGGARLLRPRLLLAGLIKLSYDPLLLVLYRERTAAS